jgi:hypothetical protein
LYFSKTAYQKQNKKIKINSKMIAKVALVLCFCLVNALAAPIDGLGPSITYHGLLAPQQKLLTAPGISIAGPKLLTGPALVQQTYAPALLKPALAVAKVAVPEPYDPNPQYSFSYGVQDQSTGDSKAQEETLVDGVIRGSYSLTEPDGTIRKVTYTADKINGFNAIVEKKGTAIIAKPALAVAKVAYAAPAITKVAYAAPALTKIAYAQPALTKLSYGSPLLQY